MWKRLAIVVLLALGAGLLTVAVSPGPAQAASIFRIKNAKSKLYLQNPPGHLQNGVEVVQQPFQSGGYQEFESVADGSYKSFMHHLSLMNLGINGASTVVGANAILAGPTGGFNQDWLVQQRSGTISVYTFKNRGSGLCLGISQASTAPGAIAAQFPCDGSVNQGWQMVPV